ncbi:MAG: DUF362 domain-containing protein [SAR202 cluster bacterium]|nr:DUF362 domain-containing protein [SAR202 cluster bacterium]|tara:strand:- start:7240 stop:8358 length:1119 start_codon:yes stop_codon:yes gene_type:complete
MAQIAVSSREDSETQSSRAKVAVLYTKPETVLDDIGRLMRLADYQSTLKDDLETILKINISWQVFYPAVSSTPWQLEGVIRTLRMDGFRDLLPSHNGTVVVDAHEGAIKNKHHSVTERYGLPSVYLEEVPWSQYVPKAEMMVLDDIFPDGITIPEMFPGRNIIHLPTMKTHVFTTITGAMKNAFGGLLNHKRHWTHSVIHETLVDLLAIQKEIHPGIFAVMDGTFAGDGPGPRAMRWHEKNVILASSDQVAIDAIAAKMMGIDPMSVKFIRLAHERGLGVGDPRDIEVVGEDIEEVNWNMQASEETFASRGQKLIYWGPLKRLETLLLRTVLAPWSYAASNIYHNGYWYNFVGRRRVKAALQTPWGRLFQKY